MERMIDFPPAVWAALEAAARADDVTLRQILRDAVDRELRRRTAARKAERPDERLIAPLRALLADDFAFARTWQDLSARLLAKGYLLVESGPGLVVASAADGGRVCKASDLGYSHARLSARLGGAFPAHSHGHVITRYRLAQPR